MVYRSSRVLWTSLALLAVPVTVSGQYRTYSQIQQFLFETEADHLAICEVHTLGTSVQGRHIRALRITDNLALEEDEPEFKYVSTMHGDETVGNEMCLFLIDHLTDNYGTDPFVTNLVNEMDIWIVPLMNPDGYVAHTRNNANGVNLNRDFPDPYTSPSNTPAGREPETGVIMNWSFEHSFTLGANLHTGALVVNYPYDTGPGGSGGSVYSACPDDDLFIYISEQYSQHNPPMWNSPYFYHGITNGADWYTINGGMQDWNYRYMRCNAVTLELSDVKDPPASQLPTFWNNNRESMLAYMATALIGVRGVVTDEDTGLPLDATVSVVGRNQPVFTDPDVGDYHRMLLPGTYDLRFDAAGFDPVFRTGVPVLEGDATRVDVAMGEPPTIVLSPNGGESLPLGAPVTVSWSGLTTTAYHVQYSVNYGDIDTLFDDFEDGSLGPDYATGGSADWYVTTEAAQGGIRSVRSGDIGDGQVSWLTRSVGGGLVKFFYRVSSESGYDFFRFYVDGVEELSASGTVGWTKYVITLPAGEHELKWEYAKDGSVSNGHDTVWVDDLQVQADNTTWHDVVAETAPGAQSVIWTPGEAGTSCKVRVRSVFPAGYYGGWDESDAPFAVVEAPPDGDYDSDGDVDLADYAGLQGCLGPVVSGPCQRFDFDGDEVIDAADYVAFEAGLDGP